MTVINTNTRGDFDRQRSHKKRARYEPGDGATINWCTN